MRAGQKGQIRERKNKVESKVGQTGRKTKKAQEEAKTFKDAFKSAKNDLSALKLAFRNVRGSHKDHPLTMHFKEINALANPLQKDKEMVILLKKFAETTRRETLTARHTESTCTSSFAGSLGERASCCPRLALLGVGGSVGAGVATRTSKPVSLR